MTSIKNRLLSAALALAMLTVSGCASLQPTPPPAPQPPPPPPEEVRVSVVFNGLAISIYHPDTRIMYVWFGEPRAIQQRPMICIKMKLSDTPSEAPKTEHCS